MTSSPHYIESSNLSDSWIQAVRAVREAPGKHELSPMIVSIMGFDDARNPIENVAVRDGLDGLLNRDGYWGVDTVANTIFPISLWNKNKERQVLYDRFSRIYSVMRKTKENRFGTYFQRMIDGGPEGGENQLEFALQTFLSRDGVRQSVLQVGIFNPGIDHTTAALRGFPCLQHVTFSPTEFGLNVHAFYANQYLMSRAYGNYLGLCRLGHFVAHYLKIPLHRVTVYAGRVQIEPKFHVGDINALLELAGDSSNGTK